MPKLAEIRREKHLSLRNLAVRARVSHATINSVERGRGRPTAETIQRICAALDVTPDQVDEFTGLRF